MGNGLKKRRASEHKSERGRLPALRRGVVGVTREQEKLSPWRGERPIVDNSGDAACKDSAVG